MHVRRRSAPVSNRFLKNAFLGQALSRFPLWKGEFPSARKLSRPNRRSGIVNAAALRQTNQTFSEPMAKISRRDGSDAGIRERASCTGIYRRRGFFPFIIF